MAQEIYAVLQIICVILTYISVIRLLQYDRLSKEYKLLLVVLCFIFVYNVCSTFQMYVQSEEAALIALKLRTLCTGQILLYMFKFIRKYCKVRVPQWIPIAYWILNAVLIIAVFWAQRGGFYFKSIEFVKQGSGGYLVTEQGPMYYLFIFFVLSLGIWMVGIICYSYLTGKRKWNWGGLCLLLSILLPCISAVMYFAGLFGTFNPNGITLFLSVELLIVSTYAYGMFDVLEGARERIIDTMNQALIIVDENKCFLDANQKAKQMYPVLAQLKKGDKIKIPSGIKVDEKIPEFEFEQDGHYYEGQITPVFYDGILQGFSACIFDITEKRHHMEQIIAARNEADRANRAKTRFLSNISHELRTPLNAIIGMSEIELRKRQEEETRFNLQSIYYSGQNLLGLVNNLLDISKIEAEKLVIEKAEYNFDSLLYEVANTIFTSLRESEIEFKVLIEDTVPKHLVGDAVRVRGILVNLLGNAMKYTKKGHIYLKVCWQADEEKDGGYLNFIVEDTGIGIKSEDIDSIFKEYEQINSEETKGITGTGLGLSITKQMVELMDGEIHVKSSYGKGSIFEAAVKQGIQNQGYIGRQVITKNNIMSLLEKDRLEKEWIEDFHGKHILIVDDMEVNRTVLKGILEFYQLIIDTASSGKEAIHKVQINDYDLIFMDQMMPELDGMNTIKMIRALSGEKYQKIPAVLVTANVMAEQENALKECGFQDYLTKPVNVGKLAHVLKKWLGEDGFPEKETENNLSVMIDRKEGLSHVGGREELYKEVLKAFYHDGTKALVKLKNAGDIPITELRTLVHGIKGSSYNIGAMELGDEAEQIEFALKKGNIEFMKFNLPSMIEHLEEVLNIISADFEQVETKEKREIDEEFVQRLKRLRNGFDDYNMGTVENQIEELERFDYGEEAAERIGQLKDCIQDLEYEAGVELLDQWLKLF